MRRTAAAVILIISLFMTDAAIADQIDDALEHGDFKTAHRLLQARAKKGVLSAQHNLGVMYQNGNGVPQDYSEAAKWYRKAAVQGFAPSQTNLALMYYRGEGVPQSPTEAVKWYKKAADQGYASAQSHLGGMYVIGRGVPRDYVLAHMWYNLAASNYSPSESEERGEAVKARNLAATLLTDAQVAEAQKLAREWKPKKEK